MDSPSSEHAAGASQMRVLVVENHEPTQIFLQYALQGAYDLTVVSTPDQAIAAAEATSFSGILVDIALQSPHDGIDVMTTLRRLDAYADAPIVAMTAYAMPGDEERFLEAGFDAYISKPFVRVEILDLLEALLHQESPS